jgi:hypothetical protein
LALGLDVAQTAQQRRRVGRRNLTDRQVKKPHELMQSPLTRVEREHALRNLRRGLPGGPSEQNLGNPRPGTVAVKGGTRRKTANSQLVVNTAAEVSGQISARRMGRLVETKALVCIERRCDATQTTAPGTVHLQFRDHGNLLVWLKGQNDEASGRERPEAFFRSYQMWLPA